MQIFRDICVIVIMLVAFLLYGTGAVLQKLSFGLAFVAHRVDPDKEKGAWRAFEEINRRG